MKTIHPLNIHKIDQKKFKNKCTSCIILSHDKKIILQKRGDDFKTFPGFTSTFGGKVESNETPIQAIIRELKEELGADVKENEINFIAVYTEEITHHSDLIYGYFWHDKNNKITGCYEGEIQCFNNINEVLLISKLVDDVKYLLKECKNQFLK